MLYQLKHKSSPGEIKKKLCLLKSTFNNWLILKKINKKQTGSFSLLGKLALTNYFSTYYRSKISSSCFSSETGFK